MVRHQPGGFCVEASGKIAAINNPCPQYNAVLKNSTARNEAREAIPKGGRRNQHKNFVPRYNGR